jgi:ATP adenylyltransferase
MQQLWAPWRRPYLEAAEHPAGCFFCEIGAGRAGPEDEEIVVWRGQHVYALLNAFPYANGHVMVAPYGHEDALDGIDTATATELMAGVRRMVAALRQTYRPDGFNVGANLGAAAGAGYGDHLHVHVVPRWSGDTSFMTTTGTTRVIPEELGETARRLRATLAMRSVEEE